MKITVKGSCPPVLFRDSHGQLYITPTSNGWLPVPDGTTLDDIEWTPDFKTRPDKAGKPTVAKVKSSDGKKVYLVTTFPNGRQTCTCPGFTFRRFCKHTGAK